MCDVFSWIEDKDGKIWFLEDKDCEIYMERNPDAGWDDVVGHDTIRKMFGVKGAEHESVLSVPSEIREAVNAGRCDKLLKANHWKGLRYDADGNISSPWPGEFISSLKTIKWLDNHGNIDKTWNLFDTRDAARAAAWDAAGAAARAAAWDAARAAAWAAAWAAARAAARDAAGAAAGDAAGAAARAAAGAAAWAAAGAAARDAALYARCLVAFGNTAKNKHIAHAKKCMAVWSDGYGLLCDVNGVLYVYRKI